GIPIFLGAVAIGSFAVHLAVLSSTGWVSDFLKGDKMGSGGETAMSSEGEVKAASFETRGDELVVTLPDGRKAVAVIRSEAMTAAYSPPPLQTH
ncbi:MAG: light-harvesting protein, partial [Pseudomonadota bacterium]